MTEVWIRCAPYKPATGCKHKGRKSDWGVVMELRMKFRLFAPQPGRFLAPYLLVRRAWSAGRLAPDQAFCQVVGSAGAAQKGSVGGRPSGSNAALQR